jgi:4-aminobutyrate aminotransferase-like enzyme
VLDVVTDERLQHRADVLGRRMLDGLGELASRHEVVGDVRGTGLFVGVELVTDRAARVPAGATAARVIEEVKARGVLISSDGPEHNVLKVKPPMVLSEADVDRFVTVLGEALTTVIAS